ncbi:hypothetical protein Mal48_33770 [Thalassoglobus polymorphus]|uniref:Uncharacterized protein n=1 Tax=Thalassoglobus polymorphus TaxID=2527994 RepID=A0A517QR57_9PLAN|nr:hypothetical protein Mal48_33770 [Thalassoglobus polymorphus]
MGKELLRWNYEFISVFAVSRTTVISEISVQTGQVAVIANLVGNSNKEMPEKRLLNTESRIIFAKLRGATDGELVR